MISVNNLSVVFTGQELFSNVTFNIQDKDRVGLVGKNGAGKSTLLKVLCRSVEPETGSIVVASGQTVGYLPQEMIPNGSMSVIKETLTAFSEIDHLEQEQLRLADVIASRTDYESAEYTRLLDLYHDNSERMLMLGAANRQERAEKILHGLGFKQSDMERPITEFSGGWQMRVELAKLLLRQPDFLLLDEPTNHLDIESIQWLETFLSNYAGAVVLVSHDRSFLDNITKRTIEITAGKIYDYKVSYSEYVIQMQERRASQMASLTHQQRQIAQIEAFVERFRYKATKAKQVQSRLKMLDKIEAVQVDEISTEQIHFQFQPAPHCGKVAFEAAQVGKSYGDHRVFDSVDMLIESGSKIAFVGKNGEGKSTMAKIIVGELSDYSGVFKLGHNVSIGYYAQNQAAMLDGEKTVFQTIDDIAMGDIRPKIRNILGSFLFGTEDIEKKVKVLSGGEKARLALAKLLLSPCNLLVLDEPTNHLDMNSKDILKNALLQYDGTLVVVSHDRDFLQGLTDSLYEFRNGGVKEFKGDVFEFLEYRRIEDLKSLDQVVQSQNVSATNDSSSKQDYLLSKEREKELRKMRNAVTKIEGEICDLESQLAEIESMLSGANLPTEDAYAKYQSLKNLLDSKMQEWEEASLRLEEASGN